MNDYAKQTQSEANFKGKKMPKHGYFALSLTHFTEQSILNAVSWQFGQSTTK